MKNDKKKTTEISQYYDGKREKFARNEISFWIDFFMSTAYTIDSIKKLFYGFYMGGVATAS